MSQAKGLICQKHCGTAFSPTWKTKVIVDQVTVAQYLGDPGPTARTNHHPKLRWSLSYRICQISITTTWSSFLVLSSPYLPPLLLLLLLLLPIVSLSEVPSSTYQSQYVCKIVGVCTESLIMSTLWTKLKSWFTSRTLCLRVFKILKNWKTFHLFELKILYYVAIIWSTHNPILS